MRSRRSSTSDLTEPVSPTGSVSLASLDHSIQHLVPIAARRLVELPHAVVPPRTFPHVAANASQGRSAPDPTPESRWPRRRGPRTYHSRSVDPEPSVPWRLPPKSPMNPVTSTNPISSFFFTSPNCKLNSLTFGTSFRALKCSRVISSVRRRQDSPSCLATRCPR
jgi:hypothetical protein